MRFLKPNKQNVQPEASPYELHRALPNPHFEGVPSRRSRMQPGQEPVIKPHKFRKIAISALVFVLVVGMGYGGWLSWKFADNAVRVFGWDGLFSLLWPSHLNGEDTGRVTILLAGDSSDDPGHQGADLTDSIMLVSINTRDDTAYLLSVPRDLYVNIPGAGYAKINEAYQDGNQQNFSEPGFAPGGMGLLEEVVSQKFNMPIDYYALINYAAIKGAVDAVGGITVNIQSPDGRLYDPNRDYTTGGPLVDLTNGIHQLDGEQALDLARARGDPSPYGYSIGFENSDFTRTADQRMMLVALKDKATSFSVLANPIHFGELLDSFGGNVKTDLTLGNVRRLYSLSRKIPSAKIQSASLNAATVNGQANVDLLRGYLTPTGEDALSPVAGVNNYTQVDDYVQQLNSQ